MVGVIVCCIVCGILFIFKPCSTSEQDSLAVGMMSGWAPFMTVNAQGEYEGFDVDVAQAIAQKMGKNLVIKDLGSLAPTFVALEQGKIDMVMSGLDITQARLNEMSMIPYTGTDVREFILLFWGKVPDGISSIKDLAKNNCVVCVEPGSEQEKYLDSIKGISQKSLSRVEDMILDVKFGKSTAFLVEARVGKRMMSFNPELKQLVVSLPQEFMTFGYGIAISARNQSLVKKITSIIMQLKTEGTLKQLEAKWRLEE